MGVWYLRGQDREKKGRKGVGVEAGPGTGGRRSVRWGEAMGRIWICFVSGDGGMGVGEGGGRVDVGGGVGFGGWETREVRVSVGLEVLGAVELGGGGGSRGDGCWVEGWVRGFR